MRAAARWEQSDDDVYSYEVAGRCLAHWFPEFVPAPAAQPLPPEDLTNITREAGAMLRANNRYVGTMGQAKSLVWFHSSASKPELEDPTRHYTAKRLARLLENGLGVDSFKEDAALLSFRLNEMLKSAGDQIYRLKPEMMGLKATLTAFQQKVDKDFVTADGAMSKHQFRVFLAITAAHMNKQNSRRIS
jgi:hypothetical protein